MGIYTDDYRGSSMRNAPASKERCRRGCAPLGCVGPGIGVWRRPTCSTSPLPPRSISTVLSHGSTDSHGRTRAPPVSPPSRQSPRFSPTRQPPDVLLRFALPLRTATHAALHRLDLFYTT